MVLESKGPRKANGREDLNFLSGLGCFYNCWGRHLRHPHLVGVHRAEGEVVKIGRTECTVDTDSFSHLCLRLHAGSRVGTDSST